MNMVVLKIALSMLLGIALMSSASLANAEIYKWTDKNGKVHYSDKPFDAESEKIKIKLAPVSTQDPITGEGRKVRAKNFLRAREEERAENNKILADKKQLKKKRKKKCVAAKKEFKELSWARGIYYEGEDGEREFIGDEERTRVLVAAKADIKKWCN